MKKVVIIFILSMMLLSTYPSVSATSDSPTAAQGAILVEAETGTILYEFNSHHQHPADHLTRIMTLLLVSRAVESEDADLTERITMTESAWEGIGRGVPTRNIQPGEEMTLRDLMYSAFLGGASEASNRIAEHVAGNVESFVALMNYYARELGAHRTTFVNTHGTHNAAQVTTAYDKYIIFREAMSYPIFAEIAGTQRHTTDATNRSEARNLTSTNPMLNSRSVYHFPNCVAGKASNTFYGGYSFVAMAENDELTLISVILGSDSIAVAGGAFLMRNISEARRLFDWGFETFAFRAILSSSEIVTRAPIRHGAGLDFVNMRPEISLVRLLSNEVSLDDFDRDITVFSIENDEPLYAPITAGEILGEIRLTRNGVYYGTVRLIANTNVDLHSFEFFMMQVRAVLSSRITRVIVVVAVLLVVAYAALVIRYNIARRKRMQRNARKRAKLVAERQKQQQEESRQMFRD